MANRDASLGDLEVVAGGIVAITDDEHRGGGHARTARGMTALYVGGMGAKGRNFYNTIFQRYGYEEEASKIQDLYLDGHMARPRPSSPRTTCEATSMAGGGRGARPHPGLS